jgi:hypothetical protein
MAKKQAPASPKAARPEQSKGSRDTSTFAWAKYLTWIHIIIITIVFWLVYSMIFDTKPDMNGDNFAYYLLGQRLAHGLGFTNATEISHGPHIHFSPGYPVFIAIIMKVFGEDQDTIDFMNGLMMYGSLLLLYFLIRRLTSSVALAFSSAFLLSLNAHLLRSSTIMMSEIPFIFMSLVAIYALIRAVEDQRGIKSYWLYVSILAMAACYYTKTTALALAGGACLYLLLSRDWKRTLIVGLSFFLLILPWSIRSKRVGSSYAGQFMQINPYKPELGNINAAAFAERIKHNFTRYISSDIPTSIFDLDVNLKKTMEGFQRAQETQKQELSKTANQEMSIAGKTEADRKAIQDKLDRDTKEIDSRAPGIFWIFGIAIIALALWGIYRLRDYRIFIAGYILGTMAILLVWPDVWGGSRFIMPLIPIIFFLMLYGVKELAELLAGPNVAKYLPYAFLLIGMTSSDPISAIQEQAQQPFPANYVNYFEIAKWAKKNTPKDAIFSARKMDMFIYYSDRMCIGDKPSLNDTVVMDYFRQNKVDYVVVEQLGFSSTAKYLVPAIQKNQDKFEVVLQLPNPDTYLLKFKRDKQ